MNSCPLCFEDMEVAYTTTCKHSYHKKCFDTYITDLIRREKAPNCPMCRSFLTIEISDYVKEGEMKCISPWCSFTFAREGETYFCVDCDLKYCLDCNHPFDPDCECIKIRREQDEEFSILFDDIKRCPYCDALVCNEEEGPDKWVTCICGVEFCFVCVSADCSCN